MREFGAVEAKSRFGDLLDLVELGEDVMIIRDGQPIARIVPARKHVDRDEARAAIERLRIRAELSGLGPFDWAEWKTYRDEGRL